MRRLSRFLPFTTFSGAAWFAYRHRRPLLDWGSWTVRSVPRVVQGEHDDVLAEARLRLRLAGDERLDGDRIRVDVANGRARVTGRIAPGHAELVEDLTEDAPGVAAVELALRERSRGQPAPA